VLHQVMSIAIISNFSVTRNSRYH